MQLLLTGILLALTSLSTGISLCSMSPQLSLGSILFVVAWNSVCYPLGVPSIQPLFHEYPSAHRLYFSSYSLPPLLPSHLLKFSHHQSIHFHILPPLRHDSKTQKLPSDYLQSCSLPNLDHKFNSQNCGIPSVAMFSVLSFLLRIR